MTILLVVLLLVLFVVFLVLLVLDFGGVWGWLLLYAVGAYGGVGVVGGAVVPEGKDSTIKFLHQRRTTRIFYQY